MSVGACMPHYSTLIPPFIVSVAERPDRDGEGLPHRVQSVLHHFRLVADGKSVHTGGQRLKNQERN